MQYYLNGKKLNLTAKDILGEGGEAVIYRHGNMAIKIYKQPDHSDFVNNPTACQAVEKKLNEYQLKLKQFPKLPAKAVSPLGLILNDNNKIVGYAMNLLSSTEPIWSLSQAKYRQVCSSRQACEILKDLHKTILGIHAEKVIIGDFNDLNVMITDDEAYLIDCDSMQWDKFYCNLFTDRFVDPLNCDSKKDKLNLIKPHTMMSDWYAYLLMVFQSLLLVHPYGGVYRGKDKTINASNRSLNRITIMHKDVNIPRVAITFDSLPDDLLQHFHKVLEKDHREVFPYKLLELKWNKCNSCGLEHTKIQCPVCYGPSAVARTVYTAIGNVTCTNLFHGYDILCVTSESNKLKWLYRDNNNNLVRENGGVVCSDNLSKKTRYRIQNNLTWFGSKSKLFSVDENGNQSDLLSTDKYNNLPIFDTNEYCMFWLNEGRLLRNDKPMPRYIRDVVENRTLLWTGADFGFGISHAGSIKLIFTFNEKSFLAEILNPPIPVGQFVDSTCIFSKDTVWFFATINSGSRLENHCFVYDKFCHLLGHDSTIFGDGSWLGEIRGKCTIGSKRLLVPTDDGVVQVICEEDNQRIGVAKIFPDSKLFVNDHSQLFIVNDGLAVVGQQKIDILKIK